MSDFSLDSLSSLLDDELSLDAEAGSVPQPVAPTPVPALDPSALDRGLSPSMDGRGGLPSPACREIPVPASPVTAPISLSSAPAAPTELVSVTAARLASLAQPPSSVRKSALEETQLYKSTPQPTIDLAQVRRSAIEPTQAFTGNLHDHVDVSATIPALVDPKKSSIPEATFASADDSEAADLTTAFQHVEHFPAASVEEPTPAAEISSQPIVDAALASATAPTLPPQLAPFFEGQPRRTTDARWEQAVESDRQFTTMLLSDMEELPWRAGDVNPPSPAVEASRPRPSANLPSVVEAIEEPAANLGAPSAALPAPPLDIESPALDPHAFDVLEVVGAEQASVAATLAPQLHSAPHEAPVVAPAKPKFEEPTPEIRDLAAFVLDRFTPGVSTVVALVGCEATPPGAKASLALAAAVADATGVSTLIVDGDFANRDISSAVEFAAASGFAEALGEPAKGRSYAQAISRENLNLLPAGNAMPETAEAPACVAAWIARAKQEYGLILVWLGAGEGDFARRLCGAADATLLLAAVDRDRPSRIEAASERLRSSNARTLGVALVR